MFATTLASLRTASLLLTVCAAAACNSGPPADTTDLNGLEGDLVGGTGTLTGTYGGESIAPIMAAYFVGQPDDPAESNGGPFIYLFSSPVTCNDISVTGWLSDLPDDGQVLEMIVGTTALDAPTETSSSAGANVSEVNYLFGRPSDEVRATGGTVTLTSYTPNVTVGGTISVDFPSDTADGEFEAVYCAGGQEESR